MGLSFTLLYHGLLLPRGGKHSGHPVGGGGIESKGQSDFYALVSSRLGP